MTTTIKDKLMEVDGIGASKADELIKLGVKRISDLRKRGLNLPLQTKLYLKHKPLKKIPYALIQEIDSKLKSKFKMLKIQYCILGSYRRKKPYSRDIDIQIITTNSMDKPISVISSLGSIEIYARGEDKLSGYLKYGGHILKLDMFKSIPTEAVAMKLYATGSKDWNIYMRSVAKKNGYLLNQKGLFDSKGNKIKCISEKCIFDKLGIKYIAPQFRDNPWNHHNK